MMCALHLKMEALGYLQFLCTEQPHAIYIPTGYM